MLTKPYEMTPAAYTPAQVDNAQTIWAYMDEARSTIYAKKGNRAQKARYAKWAGIVDGMGSAELRTIAARLGVYAEDVWLAYQSEVETNPDGRDFHKSGASWHYEGIPFLIEKVADFTGRGLFPALPPVEEAVALLEVEFLPAI